MKLQRQKAYEYKGKTKYKWVILIPSEDMEKLGWKEGIELKGTMTKDNKYILSTKFEIINQSP